MKKLFVPVTILALALGTTFTSCNEEDDDMDPQPNIVELASSNSDLSSLVAAVQRAGLVDALSDASANYTVFAPTNAAFATFLSDNGFNSVDDVPVDVLSQILLNHVLGTEVKAADVTTGYVNTLATYSTTASNIDMFINTASGVVINGGSTVVTTDVDASNGVVHVVDAVIGIPKVPTFAVANPDFSILVQALTRSDLTTNYATFLEGDGPFTVFAPTNAAFAALLTELNAQSLNDIDATTLEAVLTYHVVAGANVLAGDLTEGQTVTTAQTGTFTISLAGGAKITDGAGRETNIIATDIQGSNGVVHAIDRVLLPS
ncbi:MAG: fasciclin domain-containing protein [Flavobacteriales bacterium]|nr:fasciclin domain-containing protein [Flavobacteriales bacterium]MCB9204757.1 fasciclin domain-containing protein [Flavobacteriales bacterium]